MQVTSEQTDPCTLVLSVSVDECQVSRAFEISYRDFGKYANVPGFRPGKAPRAVLERFVDAERVRQHTLQTLVSDTCSKAIKDQQVVPLREPQIEPTDLEDHKPFSYKATIPLEPKVTVGAYTGITVEKPVFHITDEMVDSKIEEMRRERARLERIKDRPVEADDVLITELQTTLEGETDPPPPRRQLVQLGGNIPGYDEQLIGMQEGEEKTFSITYPEDFQEPTRRGKTASIYVKLLSISAKRLPDLDDDFANTAAKVDTVAALKDKVRESMQQNTERIGNEVAEHRLVQKIVESSEIHYPAVVVAEEVEDRVKQLSADLRQNNVTYAQYLAQIGLSQEEHQSRLYAEAEVKIRSILALREVARKEDLEITDEDIDAEFEDMAEAVVSAEDYDEFVGDARRRYQVASALVQQKLHQFLFGSNTVVEVERKNEPAEATA